MRVSVLDQTPVSEGSTAAEALRSSIDLARLAERLGYHRYWVAEHHGGALVAGPSPEVLIGPIAAATERMRIGSGGVMLPHYSPLKVAESFGVLAGLFPGRIDLGIGRAAGTDPMTTQVLQRDRSRPMPIDDFPEQLEELLAYFEKSFPADHPLHRIAASLPGSPEAPEPWLLGSSEQSAIWAGELGLRYAFADFINPRGAGIAALYRERFEAGARLEVPRLAVAVRALVAETEEEAERLSASWRMAFDLLRRGRPVAVPPPEKAARYLELHGDPTDRPEGRRRLTGTAAQVRADIEETVAAYGAEEVIVVTITHEHADRRHSYELLAAELGLTDDVGLIRDAT